MEPTGIAAIFLIIVNLLVSYQGFNTYGFMQHYALDVDEILIHKDYKRLLTSGFLHISWTHLLFNMISLYAFSTSLEAVVGIPKFLLIYFASLLGGNLLTLYIHRNHGDYSSVGASGAVCGVVFACIALFPGMQIGFFLLPVGIPAWLYALVYVIYTMNGIKTKRDNTAHEAHLGGGLIGLILAVGLYPVFLRLNYLPILLIAIPSAIFMFVIILRPEYLLVENLFQKGRGFRTVEDRYNQSKIEKENELNRLLDKINKKGFESLTDEEKARLKSF